MRVKQISLAASAAFVSVNIWTGAPLLALWVGSQAAGPSGLSMTAVFVVVAVLIGLVLVLVMLLNRINERYDRLLGRVAERRTSPWLRSMRSERSAFEHERHRSSAIEQVVVMSVVLAAVVLNVWFFFFAGSPLA